MTVITLKRTCTFEDTICVASSSLDAFNDDSALPVIMLSLQIIFKNTFFYFTHYYAFASISFCFSFISSKVTNPTIAVFAFFSATSRFVVNLAEIDAATKNNRFYHMHAILLRNRTFQILIHFLFLINLYM